MVFMLVQLVLTFDFMLVHVLDAVDFSVFQVFVVAVLMLFHTVDVVDLTLFQAFDTVVLMVDSAVEKNVVILLHPDLIPPSRPSEINPPCSSMTFDGDPILNTFLKPSMNGWKICVLTHSATFFMAFLMPSHRPSITFPPASSMYLLKYSFVLSQPSFSRSQKS